MCHCLREKLVHDISVFLGAGLVLGLQNRYEAVDCVHFGNVRVVLANFTHDRILVADDFCKEWALGINCCDVLDRTGQIVNKVWCGALCDFWP